MPTVPNVRAMVEAATASWPERPEIIADVAGKWRRSGRPMRHFARPEPSSLELALAGVPLVACYKLDWLASG